MYNTTSISVRLFPGIFFNRGMRYILQLHPGSFDTVCVFKLYFLLPVIGLTHDGRDLSKFEKNSVPLKLE